METKPGRDFCVGGWELQLAAAAGASPLEARLRVVWRLWTAEPYTLALGQCCSAEVEVETMKVLFLDIDGVLVLDRPGVFVVDAMERLQAVVEATQCVLVLSSDWRRREEGRRIVRSIRSRGGTRR